jgi:hypothetical protein
MPAKARKPAPVRAIAQRYPTGSAESAATAGNRYTVAIEGPKDSNGILIFDTAQHGIRDREKPGHYDARPGMTRSALEAEVARLNAGLPVSPVSQGKCGKPRPLPPAARWAEFLSAFDETREFLQAAIRRARDVTPRETAASLRA